MKSFCLFNRVVYLSNEISMFGSISLKVKWFIHGTCDNPSVTTFAKRVGEEEREGYFPNRKSRYLM